MLSQIDKLMLPFLLIPLAITGVSAAEPAPSGPTEVGELLDAVIPHLVNNKGVKVDYKEIKEKDYVLFYWSASWCGPCKRFTPKLTKFYNENGGGDKFEVVLVSLDRTEDKMKAYMKNMKMPWYAIDHSQKRNTGMKQYSGGGIPHLMLIDKSGKILGRGKGTYYAVLNKLKTILEKEQEAKTEVEKDQ